MPFQFFGPPFNSGATVSKADGGELVPFLDPADSFNFGALNYYQRPDERWTGGAFTHYNWDEHHEMYSEFMFMSDHTVAQIAPSGMFLGSGLGNIPAGFQNAGAPDGLYATNCSNPFLSAQEVERPVRRLDRGANVEMLMGRRNVEGGDRQDDLTHTSFRLVIGSKGDLVPDLLTYDIYAQEGVTLLSEEYLNEVSGNKVTQALLVGGTKANPTCLNVALFPGCVPYNIWGTGPVNPAAVQYITANGFQEGENEERVVSGNVTFDLTKPGVKLPTATTGLIVNLGAEYREEFTNLRPDVEFIGNGARADLLGQGSATLPLNAGMHVSEGFMEARLPVLQDQPFAKELSFEAGYRYSSLHARFQHQHLQVRGRLCAGVRYPPARQLQPCRARAEPAGAVCGKIRRPRRLGGSLRDERFRLARRGDSGTVHPKASAHRRQRGTVQCSWHW